MNRILTLLALIAPIATAAETDRRTWKWQQEFTVGSPGIMRLYLDPLVLDASQPSLGDLRILSPKEIETPYLVDVPKKSAQRIQTAIGFKATLVEGKTVLDASTGTDQPIIAISLASPSTDFLKSLKVEATRGAEDWEAIAPSEVIFHHSNGVKRLQIPITQGVWKQIRVTIDDQRTLPVPFTAMQLTLAGNQPASTVHPVQIVQRSENESSTSLELDLGAKNLQLSELRFTIADPLFIRRCTLSYPLRGEDGQSKVINLGSHAIYRVVGDGGASSQQVSIPIDARVPSRTLILTIPNDDNPPLKIESAEASLYPTSLVFFAAQEGNWRLLTGQALVNTPDYDISRLRSQLGSATRLSPGPLTIQTDYIKPTTLPEIEPAGAAIDLKPWTYRKPVGPPVVGVLKIQLDMEVLAHSQNNFADLRVVQNGNQIPFVISPSASTATLKPSFVVEPDPNHPNVSRWKIELPIDQLPVLALQARSSAPLFNRTFHLRSLDEDSYGNPITRFHGTAQWIKSVNNSNDAQLYLDLQGQRLPTSVMLETDNGDNPAIPLQDISITYSQPSLLAKITSDEPLFLYYGNPNARLPAYDLDLVRHSLQKAEKITTLPGKEEKLKASTASRQKVSSGSPWLWLALGSVVVVLLVIVAKLLPKSAEV